MYKIVLIWLETLIYFYNWKKDSTEKYKKKCAFPPFLSDLILEKTEQTHKTRKYFVLKLLFTLLRSHCVDWSLNNHNCRMHFNIWVLL